MDIKNFIDDEMFIGVETEGRNKGNVSLFIPATVSFDKEKILNLCAGNNIKYIYFGAGKQFNFTDEQIEVIASFSEYTKKEKLVVTVEVSKIYEKLLCTKITQVLNVPINSNIIDYSYINIKFETPTYVSVNSTDGSNHLLTYCDEPLYLLDKRI